MKKLCVARRVAGIVFVVVASASSSPGALGGVKKSQAALVNDVVKRLGLNVVEVGAPGNRAVLPSEMSGNSGATPPPDFGVVNHRYRIMALEVTKSQWAQFLNAYAPSHEAAGGLRGGEDMASGFLWNPNLSQPANYRPLDGAEQAPHPMSWYVAARFANWLHSGAPGADAATAKDFDNGAYDTSTFGATVPRPNGTGTAFADQWRRSEGSLFWIPSLNEWTKAAHYDPDRYGEGEEGYWLRQGGQNEPLISAPPQFGGETNAGDSGVWNSNFPGGPQQGQIPVGAYPHVQSPWGLMDTSGGQAEWVEDPPYDFIYPNGTLFSNRRHTLGSHGAQGLHESADRINRLSFSGPNNNFFGLRIALVIPAPAPAALAAVSLAYTFRRRR